MLAQLKLEHVLFLDIETVPMASSYDRLPNNFKKLWDHKAEHIRKGEETAEETYKRAGIYSEFGKIICISVGYVYFKGNEMGFRLKSFADKNEAKLLKEFDSLLDKHFNQDHHLLCAHNGKEFDFPYIARRCLVNGIAPPKLLDIAGKKPWEIKHLDTMEMWKFGDYKHYTSLSLLSAIFNIPTPKDDIDGSDVGRVFWEEDDLNRIVTYCQKDVLAVAQLLLRYKCLDLIKEENIEIIN